MKIRKIFTSKLAAQTRLDNLTKALNGTAKAYVEKSNAINPLITDLTFPVFRYFPPSNTLTKKQAFAAIKFRKQEFKMLFDQFETLRRLKINR